MIEAWLIEILKAIGKVFLNPLLYWSLLLVFLSGYIRIKKERSNFGSKIFDIFLEWKDTWKPAVVFGILVSVLTLGTGMVFTYMTMLLLSIVVIILSLNFRFTLLSASYSIGLTYVLLLFLPVLLEKQNYISADLFPQSQLTSLTVLLGVFLLIEAYLLGSIKRNETSPDLTAGRRGIWTGFHHIKKVNMIPFLTLIPVGEITPFADFWPYFSIGGETYSLILVPFIIGFQHKAAGTLPVQAAKQLAKSISLLGVIVLCIAAGSIFLSWLSVAAVFVAVLGREWINYNFRIKDKHQRAYFLSDHKGLKILGVIPGTPAERMGLLAGETLVKVNGSRINQKDVLYRALQDSGAFFKVEVLDDAGEKRFVQGAFYQGDHHELGLIFSAPPYRSKK